MYATGRLPDMLPWRAVDVRSMVLAGDAARWRHNAKKKSLTHLSVKPKHSGVDVRAEGASVRCEVVVLLESKDTYDEIKERARKSAQIPDLHPLS